MGIDEDINKLAGDIAASYSARAQIIGTMIQESRARAKNTRKMLKGFSSKHNERTASLKTNLKKNTADIEASVKNKLLEFSAARAERSVELKKNLAKYSADIFNGTQGLLAGFRNDREKMRAHWRAMAAARNPKRGIRPGEAEAKADMKTGIKPRPKKRVGMSARRGQSLLD